MLTGFALYRSLQVGNIKKETVVIWHKDDREVKVDDKLSFTEGVLTLEISQVSGHREHIPKQVRLPVLLELTDSKNKNTSIVLEVYKDQPQHPEKKSFQQTD